MKNKSKFKNLVGEKIFINKNETKMEGEKNNRIRTVIKNEESKDKGVKVEYNKIKTDGRTWKWNNTKR